MKHEEIKVENQDNLNGVYCPLPLSVIPNHMGINLCSVESVAWTKQDDGQLVSLTINFNPEPKECRLTSSRRTLQGRHPCTA